MRRLIIILLFLLASVWLGLQVAQHPGYLLVVYQPWMVQMPLWFATLSLLLLLGLFYILITCLDRIGFLWFRIKNWFAIRGEHRSHSKTQRGLTALIEGRWKKAESLLLAGVNQSLEPLTNYLNAAKAAHELGAFERRDQYIQKAYHVAPHATVAIGITQAELEYKQERFEQATATLRHLYQQSKRHPQVLRLLEKVYIRQADWKNLHAILPNMRRAKLLTSKEYEAFEKNLYCEMLNAATNQRLSDIRAIWKEVPRYLRKQPDVVCAYVKQLSRHAPITGTETTKEMEELIRQVLKHEWHPELANIYSSLTFTNVNRQLVIAGAWMKMYGQQPELLLMLGKFCTKLQLWGRAKDYFTKCLAIRPNADATLEYGRLLEKLGESDQATMLYRDNLVAVAEVSGSACSPSGLT